MATTQPGAYAAAVPSADDVRSMAGPATIVLAIRAALPVLFYLLSMVGVSLGSFQVYNGIRGLLTFVGVVLYLVWFARAYNWLRAARGGTAYSTGLAVGGWFIPLANFVLPVLAQSDAWKRAHGSSSPLPVVWWLSYLLTMFLGMFEAANLALNGKLMPFEMHTANTIYTALYWLGFVGQIVAYGLWAHIVREITARIGQSQR